MPPSAMSPLTSAPSPAVMFEASLARLTGELREALSELIARLPEQVDRAVDLERALRLDRKLAWQVFRLSRSTGLGEVGNVPSLISAARVLEAARGRQVPESVIQRAQAAFEQFEAFAIEQCGDRAALATMANGLAHDRSETLELRTRKALFRANAHIWGLQAEMLVRTLIYVPEVVGGPTTTVLLIAGNIGLQGLRRGEPLMISSWLSDAPLAEAAKDPADADAPARAFRPGFDLLPEYCSPNLPPLTHRPGPSGMVETEMNIPPSGRSGALTTYLSQSAPAHGDVRTQGATAGMFTSVPAGTLVEDMLVPAGYSLPASLRVSVFGRRHHPERVFEERTVDLLPQREQALYLGAHTTLPTIDGVPRHHEAVAAVLAQRGLAGQAFDVYRCRVEYPVLHTLLNIKVDGAEQPTAPAQARARD